MIDKLKLPADKKDQITIKETDIFKPENLDLTGKIPQKLNIIYTAEHNSYKVSKILA